MQTVVLGFPHGISGAVLLGLLVWVVGAVAVAALVLLLVALGARADRRRRDVDLALAACLGPPGSALDTSTAWSGRLVRGKGRRTMWHSVQLVSSETNVSDEVVGHLLSDARRELSARGLEPVGEPHLETQRVVWLEAWPDAPVGTYVSAARAPKSGKGKPATVAALSVTWPVAACAAPDRFVLR